MNKESGVTLMELLMTVVIVGILAAIAMPIFTRVVESTKAKNAVSALQQILTGEQIYRMEENAYWWPSSGGTSKAHIEDINSTLITSLDKRKERNWHYLVRQHPAYPEDHDYFIGIAVRKNGMYQGGKIIIDQGGVLTATGGWPPFLLPGD